MTYSDNAIVQNSARELAAQRTELAKALKRMAEKSQVDFTPEDEANWNKANADYDRLSDEIKAIERKARLDAIDAESRELSDSAKWVKRQSKGFGPVDNEATISRALTAWIKNDCRLSLNDGDIEAMRACNIDPRQQEVAIKMMPDAPKSREDVRDWAKVQRDLAVGSITTSSSGAGTLVPIGFVRNLEEALLNYFPALQEFDVLRTPSGNPLPWPTINDTGNKGALLSEAGSIGAAVDPTEGQQVFNAYKISSTPIKISAEALEDNFLGAALANKIGQWLGTRIARKVADFCTTGTGSSQPQGMVTGANVGATTASPTAISFADIVSKLAPSLDPAYTPRAKFMGHFSTLWYLRSLVDSTGRSLFWNFQQSLSTQFGYELLGVPFIVNQSMAAVSAGAPSANQKLLAYGDFSKMMVRWVSEVRFYQLDQLYRANDQIGYIAFARMDSAVLDSGTHPIQLLQQHS